MSKFERLCSMPAMSALVVLMVSPAHCLPRTLSRHRRSRPSSRRLPLSPQPNRLRNPLLRSFLRRLPRRPKLAKLLPVSPSTQPTPEQLGDSLAGHQRYQAAIAAYSKITDPSAEVWNKLGIAYQMMFNPKDAARCYNASLKLDPRNATVLNNLATVYDSLKEYGAAEKYYRKALKIDPHSALVLRNFGSNQLAQHKYKKGWEAYQSALKIDPHIFESRSGASVGNPASTQERGAMHYYMARGCVSAGNAVCAIQNLRLALNEGYTNPQKIADDRRLCQPSRAPGFPAIDRRPKHVSIGRAPHESFPVVPQAAFRVYGNRAVKQGPAFKQVSRSAHENPSLASYRLLACAWCCLRSECSCRSRCLAGQRQRSQGRRLRPVRRPRRLWGRHGNGWR